MDKVIRFVFKQWIRFLDALGFANFVTLLAVLFIALVLISSVGCTRYEHEFLANCDRVNDETLKCYACDTEWLVDFPVVEDHIQVKARVEFQDGNNCGWLYFFYGGKHDSHRIATNDARYIYDCIKNGLDYDDDEEFYDDDIYYDDTASNDQPTNAEIVKRIEELKQQSQPLPKKLEPVVKDGIKELRKQMDERNDWRAMP